MTFLAKTSLQCFSRSTYKHRMKSHGQGCVSQKHCMPMINLGLQCFWETPMSDAVPDKNRMGNNVIALSISIDILSEVCVLYGNLGRNHFGEL